jgi:hypothetical protein
MLLLLAPETKSIAAEAAPTAIYFDQNLPAW